MQAAGFGWNDGYRALVGNGCQHLICVIGLVAYNRARWVSEGGQQAGQLRAVSTLRRSQGQKQTVTQRVDYGVDFGAEAAATAPEAFGAGRAFF
ncbi:hypothetical protein GCM10023172_15840 [Hymenobacter ginsengisoli]|uniref:Uncharacterized protein n=1 Tax=Hymenobacter ginsengisoli TaxID=1051626 RepID=A0ABP8QAD3_9BACT